MYLRKKLMMLAFVLTLLTFSACSTQNHGNNSSNEINNEPSKNLENKNMESEDEDIEEKDVPPKVMEDEELEESLASFRKERETMVGEKMGGGLVGFGAPNLEDYGIDESKINYQPEFDSRETAEAYETAKNYVQDTLGIKIETKSTTYMCVDPRMYKIYEDEDKGVAQGYENDNIFITEYYDGENWQYLILVRDAKGEPWEVIHHGSNYKE